MPCGKKKGRKQPIEKRPHPKSRGETTHHDYDDPLEEYEERTGKSGHRKKS